MTDSSSPPFPDSKQAALALLATADLSQREGQFLGGAAFQTYPLTDKQVRWLKILLDRHGLPALAEGGAA